MKQNYNEILREYRICLLYTSYVNELSVKHGELKAIGYEPESEAELSAIL